MFKDKHGQTAWIVQRNKKRYQSKNERKNEQFKIVRMILKTIVYLPNERFFEDSFEKKRSILF